MSLIKHNLFHLYYIILQTEVMNVSSY